MDNLPSPSPFLRIDGAPNVVLDAIKQCEEDSDSFIVRVYEAYGGRGTVKLVVSEQLCCIKASRCNLLEESQEELDIVDSAVQFPIKPFQIISLKLQVLLSVPLSFFR